MILAEKRILPEAWDLPLSCSKKTPGERCSWLTMTRSVPLMMKVARAVMRGISPKNTSCSLTSRMVREGGFQSERLPFLGRDDHLQEVVVRFLLRLDEIRYFNDLSDLGEIDPLDQIPVFQIRHVLTPGVLAKVELPGGVKCPPLSVCRTSPIGFPPCPPPLRSSSSVPRLPSFRSLP